jgi:hypothetical protein
LEDLGVDNVNNIIKMCLKSDLGVN